MKRDLERFEVSPGMAGMVTRRTAPILGHYARCAAHGSLDLNGLSLSCYLQGVHDTAALAAKRPNLIAELNAGNGDTQ